MELQDLVARLVQIDGAPTPVVSVYLNTRWADEHQRERVRIFLKGELRKARLATADPALQADLDWVEAEGEALIDQSRFPDARGVALFACRGLDLREVLPLRVPVEDAFVVGPGPLLRPLAALPGEAAAIVVFVDGECARLIPVGEDGVTEEIVLDSDVQGHHRRGGWAQLAQSRYQRHIEAQRGRHFGAVAEALIELGDRSGIRHIVLAGDPGTVATFRSHLPTPMAEQVLGPIGASRHEPARALVARATALIAQHEAAQTAAQLDTLLARAAKGGRAVAGADETAEAAGRGAVHRLYLLRRFRQAGRSCAACGHLGPGTHAACPRCGATVREVELSEALPARVLATGGAVAVVDAHDGLSRVGGVAALLRYAL